MIGVVGPDAERVVERCERVGARAAPATANDVPPEATSILALGPDATSHVVATEPAVPVLAVDAGRGLNAVPSEAVERAVQRLSDDESPAGDASEEVKICERRAFVVEHPAGRRVATFEATLTTDEPATISEFGVRVGDATPRRVADFRADGVVVATPAGSFEYANTAGGPLVDPTTEVAAVVPIAPFSIRPDHWVLSTPLAVSVEREEAAVVLRVDGRDAGEVPAGASVRIRAGPRVEFLSVPEGRRGFPRD